MKQPQQTYRPHFEPEPEGGYAVDQSITGRSESSRLERLRSARGL